ncbi:MAG: hypothetical protein J2P25_09435 [Nocardiopsaceae bacterium]|nr:hypothetical protein [Nocardiopsaceae bacterium]
MRDPELVASAQRAATRLEAAWERWRATQGLADTPAQPVIGYVGYALKEPWGQPRAVIGFSADEAERLAEHLERDAVAVARPGDPQPAVQQPAAEQPAAEGQPGAGQSAPGESAPGQSVADQSGPAEDQSAAEPEAELAADRSLSAITRFLRQPQRPFRNRCNNVKC